MTATEISFLEDLKNAQVSYVNGVATKTIIRDSDLLNLSFTKVSLLNAMIDIIEHWFIGESEQVMSPLYNAEAPAGYDTFSTSGRAITSAIITSGPAGYSAATAASSYFSVEVGEIFRVTIPDVLINSGEAPTIYIADENGLSVVEANKTLETGDNSFYFVADTATSNGTIFIINTTDTNYSTGIISIYRGMMDDSNFF